MIRRELEYFFGAIRFFTRLPVPGWVGHSAEALNHSARYFPAVGLLVGGIGALVYWLALLLWPQPVAVLLSMAATLYATALSTKTACRTPPTASAAAGKRRGSSRS